MASRLIIAGILLIILGVGWPLLQKLGLGRLPGDFVFKSGEFKVYLPITTCIVLSIVLTVLLLFFRK